jgi:hypothetical protein
MRAVYPERIIVMHTIVNSSMRRVARPDVPEGAGPSSVVSRIDEDAVERARERFAKLRGEF